jgi:hypothetical protein
MAGVFYSRGFGGLQKKAIPPISRLPEGGGGKWGSSRGTAPLVFEGGSGKRLFPQPGGPVRVLACAENNFRQGGRMRHYAPKGIVGPSKSD